MQGVDPAVILDDFSLLDINSPTLCANFQFCSKTCDLIFRNHLDKGGGLYKQSGEAFKSFMCGELLM